MKLSIPLRIIRAVLTVSLMLVSPLVWAVDSPEESRLSLDSAAGLKMTVGWTTVRDNCIACHSAKQFLNQRGTRQTWTKIIDWMQLKGGLWPLTDETRKEILDYLVQNNGPGENYRRPPLSADKMPTNPHRRNIVSGATGLMQTAGAN